MFAFDRPLPSFNREVYLKMTRILCIIGAVLLSGCGGDGSENAPLLKLSVNRGSDGSVGTYRVEHVGVIVSSGHGSDLSAVASQTITIDNIAENGVTVTVTLFDSDTGEFSKQFLVPFEKEITVEISQKATATARLERPE
ncbi:hypothetical protein SH528x_003558 [Novipirellula sp. SH528]|uniref:hypothetical protein n=1 Tax=Novipirellula sp. SH528 TaxID=3454466 RepID=UPI003FA08B09